MIGILHRFIASHRVSNWEKSLAKSSNMLPFVVATGHHNYLYSLPLFLQAGNEQPEKHCPICIAILHTKGHYVVLRKVGSFNGVPSDTALEQT